MDSDKTIPRSETASLPIDLSRLLKKRENIGMLRENFPKEQLPIIVAST